MQSEHSKKTFCRLCYNTITDTNYEIIGEVLKEILDVVLPSLNLEQGHEHLMCKECLSNSYAAFNFKSTCMGTEDFIQCCINSSKVSVIDLNEVYLKVNRNICLTDISEKQRICRLCIQLVTYGYISPNEADIDVMNNCLPRVNIAATKDPIICGLCFDSLRIHSSFLKKCVKAQEKYKIANKNVYIKTEETEIKLEDQDVQEPYRNIDNQIYIKSEEVEMKPEDRQDVQAKCEYVDKQCDNRTKVIEIKIEKDDRYRELFSDNIIDKTVANKMICTSNHIIGIKNECMLKYESEIKIHKCESSSDIPSHKSDIKSTFNSGLKCEAASNLKKYKCEECEFETKHMKSFRCHQLLHKDPSEVQTYKCDKCIYETKYKDHLKRHQILHKDASEIQMFKCNKCAYETKFKHNLKMHALGHKDHSEAYKCDTCTFETIYRRRLTAHQLTHKDPSRIQIYNCYTCAYKTKHKSDLIKHQLVHKNISETPMYKCGTCSYETKYKSYLKLHQLTHKNLSEIPMYKCQVCSYETKHKQYIKCHQLVHKGTSEVQMYKCDICSFETKYKKNIKNHRLKHEKFSTTQK